MASPKTPKPIRDLDADTVVEVMKHCEYMELGRGGDILRFAPNSVSDSLPGDVFSPLDAVFVLPLLNGTIPEDILIDDVSQETGHTPEELQTVIDQLLPPVP